MSNTRSSVSLKRKAEDTTPIELGEDLAHQAKRAKEILDSAKWILTSSAGDLYLPGDDIKKLAAVAETLMEMQPDADISISRSSRLLKVMDNTCSFNQYTLNS